MSPKKMELSKTASKASSRGSIVRDDLLICRPLKSFLELLTFSNKLPAWRSLCEHIKPHSKFKVKNMDHSGLRAEFISLENPYPFCHFTNDQDIDVKRVLSADLPKTLVCHDLANGYHDDSHIEGTGNFEAYTFYNWSGIDIFCYFSHNLVTVPPLGWINVGHMHGVKVIGTVITEWKEGALFWEQMLANEEEFHNLASMLVGLAKMLKFDGWLLNIENKVEAPDQLVRFVRFLHSLLHAELKDPVLIWYDSVTIEGKLHWQNALTSKNKPFFDACDGIFINYAWTPDDVEASVDLANFRSRDVYVGIDVWGRNFFGGGKFNTQEAVSVANNYGCSIAIFAPAWTFENALEESEESTIIMGADLPNYDKFLLRDRALWGSLWPYLSTKLPCTLPFKTSFCRGHGLRKYFYGELIEESPWYNLRLMQYQPNANHCPHGYMITTEEKLVHASKEEHINGILKLRQSFVEANMIRMLQLEREEAEETEETENEGSTGVEEVQEPRPDLSTYDATPSDNRDLIARQSLSARFFKFMKKKFWKKEQTVTIAEDLDRTSNQSGEAGSSTARKYTLIREKVSFNLKLGERQRLLYQLGYIEEEHECLSQYWGDAFNGGSCLMVSPTQGIGMRGNAATIRLFHCDLPIDPAVVVCVVTKTLPEHPNQKLLVHLALRDQNNQRTVVTLLGDTDSPAARCYLPINNNEDDFKKLQDFLLNTEPGFYVSDENNFGWKVRYYIVDLAGQQITSVNLKPGFDMSPILLGYIGFCRKGPPIIKPPPPSASPSLLLSRISTSSSLKC